MPEIDAGRTALRALAEAATPGPWQVDITRHHYSMVRNDGSVLAGVHVEHRILTVRDDPQAKAPHSIVTLCIGVGILSKPPIPMVHIRPEDADYLAAVSPEVVLALLDEIDALRASLAAAEKERDEALRDAIKFTQKVDAGLVHDEEYLRLHREKMEQYDRRVAAEARAEKAEAERDAARWQPIETAPRDGTRLWCFWPDAWSEERQAIGWFVSGGEDEYWTDAADSDPNPPTHWMPLPAAPDQPEDPARD